MQRYQAIGQIVWLFREGQSEVYGVVETSFKAD